MKLPGELLSGAGTPPSAVSRDRARPIIEIRFVQVLVVPPWLQAGAGSSAAMAAKTMTRRRWTGLGACAAVALLAAGCLSPGDGAIREALKRETGDAARTDAAIASFYEQRRHAPAWTGSDALSGAGVALLESLCRAGNGVPAGRLRRIDERLRAAYAEPSEDREAHAAAVARADLAMSEELLKMTLDHVHGRAGLSRVHDNWHYRVDHQSTAGAEWLERFARTGDFDAVLESLLGDHPGHARLAKVLARYREIAARGGWAPVPEGPFLDPRGADPRLDAVRARLAATSDLQGAGGDLARAVERFRARHGLEPAERIDRAAIAAMNVPVERRIAQLEVNLERQRWLPRLDQERVVVNIPEYRVHAYRDGRSVLSMRAVVGERMNQTPLFADEIRYVTFRPYWNLPRTIALEEVLPAAREDPGYLRDRGYEVVGDDGAALGAVRVAGRVMDGASRGDRPSQSDRIVPVRYERDAPDLEDGLEADELRLRQRPGPTNALGLVKFMFPNQFNVYLHDTPADGLFDESRRDFSHGCIRLEDPVRFAEFVLQGNGGWSREKIEAEMHDEEIEARQVDLKRPISVYIVYLTAWVDPEGRVQFRDDIYGHDAALREATEDDRMGAQKQDACERLQRLAAGLGAR